MNNTKGNRRDPEAKPEKSLHSGKKVDTINILFCGTGGQGVLTASEVLGWAAILDGYHVKKSEVHGMAQRGGSVESHLRFGRKVYSPLIPFGEVDYLISFHKGEHSRLKNFLKAKGTDLIHYLEKAETLLHDKRQVNTFILGALSRYLTIKEKSWIKALEAVFSHKNLEENKKIFYQGREVQL
jgi:indolepyruvate ferredoxin oxidoreductase beta subunit